MFNPDLFWNASLEELKNGYIEEGEHFTCLLCGRKIEKGLVYPDGEMFYEAGRYMRVHIEKDHGSVFEFLLSLDKRLTGLTDHQNNLLRLFYQGNSDEEVKNQLGIGSTATVRNHRFVLREKERQAKVFLTLMELLKSSGGKASVLLPPHKTAVMVDDRYGISEAEYEKVIRRYFPEGPDGPLKTFNIKEKNKLAVLRHIARRFEPGRTYSEKEVNEILKTAYEDYVTLRRYLIEYGFLDRRLDGSQYWVKAEPDETGDDNMDRKKELKAQYKTMKTEAGVFQIRNTKNQKVWVVATPNLRTVNGKLAELTLGVSKNKKLQEEWNQFGEEAFVAEVLEVLKEKEDAYFNQEEELKKLEEKWLEKLQPYGERGYN